ncbi:MAG TPA: biotin--[acetyl-CoA-carboxylase] ligase [Tepidisphaeraceae bacterium]|jgi:BirA family biotin operon repressor/biotin-[acetyl-CoA-carboxylase] ligase|nr:biotin--[acetyl-CoA-carboxylase] ligase [Tepidisphaeraceae bacterium]
MIQRTFHTALRTLGIDRLVTYYDKTDSTNTRAALAAKAGTAGDGDIFIAGAQTAGRGSDGKPWDSAEPVGLWMSIVFLEPLRTPALSLLPAVALATVLRSDHGIAAHLKWPNDVLVGTSEQTRKIAGILIESCDTPTGRAWVMGIGLNLRQSQFDGPLANIATSVRQQTGGDVAIPGFFASLVKAIDALERSSADLPAVWMEMSRMPGRTITLRRHGTQTPARVDGVTAEGYLRITHADGRRETLVGVTGIDIDPRY